MGIAAAAFNSGGCYPHNGGNLGREIPPRHARRGGRAIGGNDPARELRAREVNAAPTLCGAGRDGEDHLLAGAGEGDVRRILAAQPPRTERFRRARD